MPHITLTHSIALYSCNTRMIWLYYWPKHVGENITIKIHH